MINPDDWESWIAEVRRLAEKHDGQEELVVGSALDSYRDGATPMGYLLAVQRGRRE